MGTNTGVQLSSNSNLSLLMQSNHDQKVAETKMTACMYCDKKFSCSSTLSRHIQKVHGIPSIKGSMECLTCKKKFTIRKKLIQHLRSDHGLVITENIVVFKTSEEFELWRYEEERRSGAMYRNLIVDRPSKNGTTSILLCCRDGKYKPYQEQRVRKYKGTRKIGHTCTSHMIVNKIIEPEHKVIVKYVKTHYGHDIKEGTLVKGRKCNQKIFKTVVEHHIKNLKEPKMVRLQEGEREVVNENLRQVYLVIKKDKDMFLQPINQCKVCSQSFTGPCPITFPGYSICKHGLFFATQNLDQLNIQHDTTNVDVAATYKSDGTEKNKLTTTKFGLEYEFRKLVVKLQQYQEKVHLLPNSSQREILRLLRITYSVLNEDTNRTSFEENHCVRKIHSQKRKTVKHDDLCKTESDITKVKRVKKTIKMSPESCEPQFDAEVEVNEFALWNDHGIHIIRPIDHEEIVL